VSTLFIEAYAISSIAVICPSSKSAYASSKDASSTIFLFICFSLLPFDTKLSGG